MHQKTQRRVAKMIIGGFSGKIVRCCCFRSNNETKKTFIRVTSVLNHSKSARVFDILTIQQTNYKINLHQLTDSICYNKQKRRLLFSGIHFVSGEEEEEKNT